MFVETNSATKVDPSDDIIPPLIRHQIFTKMGMRLLDFDYVQAPLTKDKSKVSSLSFGSYHFSRPLTRFPGQLPSPSGLSQPKDPHRF